jgi:hypothetical protein
MKKKYDGASLLSLLAISSTLSVFNSNIRQRGGERDPGNAPEEEEE